ncbi:MAG: outer membrane protein assembly factor BamE [Chthoniobacterales bacterium]|nr:outer membrane protein assembly factor BamE [Chthoniobacterales bacterium]
MKIASMQNKTRFLGLLLVVLALFSLGACNRNALSGSKLNAGNYAKITLGMSKAQVETILGAPTTIDSKDVVIYKKTTYRYEDGAKFAMVTFKNDEVDSKDTNLGREQ